MDDENEGANHLRGDKHAQKGIDLVKCRQTLRAAQEYLALTAHVFNSPVSEGLGEIVLDSDGWAGLCRAYRDARTLLFTLERDLAC